MPLKARVLLVDDEPFQLELLKEMVAQLPYDLDIMTCADGSEALDLLEGLTQEDLPDLVISDHFMPRVSGADLLRQIRSNPRYSSIAFIMVSNFTNPKLQQRALELGVDDFLRRPVDFHELKARCNSFLFFSHRSRGLLENAAYFRRRFRFASSDEFPLMGETMQSLGNAAMELSGKSPQYQAALGAVMAFLLESLNVDHDSVAEARAAVMLHGFAIEPDGAGCERLDRILPATRVASPLRLAREICEFMNYPFEQTKGRYECWGIDIPLSARVAAVAVYLVDFYTNNLSSKGAAASELKIRLSDLSGTRFDPVIVSLCLEHLDTLVGLMSA